MVGYPYLPMDGIMYVFSRVYLVQLNASQVVRRSENRLLGVPDSMYVPNPSNADWKLSVGEEDRDCRCHWRHGFYFDNFVQREFSVLVINISRIN
jgi:hypothetical protein